MNLKDIVEAALFATPQSLSVARILELFDEHERPEANRVRAVLAELGEEYRARPLQLAETASGFRFQVRVELSPWIGRLFEEKPGRYSRAVLETLAIIAYRQPVTRGEIEDIRGVAVSTGVLRTLLDREWVHSVGHREVPGRPALYATTRRFLDYFGLKSLDELPTLKALGEMPEIPSPPDTTQVTPDETKQTAAPDTA
jgi:segregation and condensation protein B